MRTTGVDRFSNSVLVRLIVVVTWFTVSTIAFFSRYDRWTPTLAAMLVAVIVGSAALGLTWAVLPAIRAERRRREFTPMTRPLPRRLALRRRPGSLGLPRASTLRAIRNARGRLRVSGSSEGRSPRPTSSLTLRPRDESPDSPS